MVAAAELAAAAGEPRARSADPGRCRACLLLRRRRGDDGGTTGQALALLPARPEPARRFVCRTAHGLALVMVGEGDLGAETIRRCRGDPRVFAELPRDPSLLHGRCSGRLWLREAGADEVIERAVTEGRRQAAGSQLGHVLELASRHYATADRWTVAAAGFHEAIELARDTGYRHRSGRGAGGPLLAGGAAGQGRATAARTRTRPSSSPPRSAWRRITSGRSPALADLELGAGHLEAALEHLREQQAMLERLGIDDVDLSPVPDLVEILSDSARPAPRRRSPALPRGGGGEGAAVVMRARRPLHRPPGRRR